MSKRRVFTITLQFCICLIVGIIVAPRAVGASAVSLDTCRVWAMQHSRSLAIAKEMTRQSSNLRRAARGAYWPGVDFDGAFFYNQKPTRLIDVESLRNTVAGWGVPQELLSSLLPNDLLELDTHRVGVGAVTITQPIFMGGKIWAANEMARYAEMLAHSQYRQVGNDVITAVDEAYWLVVSLVHKARLAEDYVALVKSLYSDMNAMIAEGVATQSEGLAVAVALNEAEVLHTKAENGLSMSRMLLARLCGLPLDTIFELQDESMSVVTPWELNTYHLQGVYARREEVRSLQSMAGMARAQQRIALSDMLPSVLLVGMYSMGVPNFYNGFQTHLEGMFSVGVMVRVPIFHWGVNYYRYKVAQSAVVIADMEIEMAKESIDLQVEQTRLGYEEAVRVYKLCEHNCRQAEANMHNARIAFNEGVFTYVQLLAAQTAWQQARSELIDARVTMAVTYDNYLRAVGVPLY
ncbi:MAG: TolC family protein [Bacteroidales bacterium]|nr:TolC family protein [Bacteroidales bacterium]